MRPTGAAYAASDQFQRLLEVRLCQCLAPVVDQAATFRAEGYHRQDTLQLSV